VPDDVFEHPRLAAIYDALDPDRGDLVPYVELAEWTFVFGRDGAVLTSDSTLRFRGRDEVEADLTAQGFVLDDVRQAPDRPGLELVFLARRPG